MLRILKLVHLLGLTLFLGSISSFILISGLLEGASLELLVFGRRFIDSGTRLLTIPCLWMICLSGLWLALARRATGGGFVRIKLAIGILMVLNTHLLITPAVHAALDIATRSLAAGAVLPQFQDAYLRESIAGAVNVAFALVAVVVGVWKLGVQRAQPGAGPLPPT